MSFRAEFICEFLLFLDRCFSSYFFLFVVREGRLRDDKLKLEVGVVRRNGREVFFLVGSFFEVFSFVC